MIYVTGDMHGDISRFKSSDMRKLKKHDYLIICGDFGFVWDGSKKEDRCLKWIGKRRYQVLFVEGTHDNYDLLGKYPQSQWNGGNVREISGKLKLLCRGSVFNIDGKSVFAFGGGESDDRNLRLSARRWWAQELPTTEEVQTARENLALCGDKVDYIVTHQCSRKLKQLITMRDDDANILDTFFDEVRVNCKFSRWFFGGYHINKNIPPAETALFDVVMPVEGKK